MESFFVLQFVFLFLLLIAIGWILYLHIAFPFWCRQPVVHPYDFFRWPSSLPQFILKPTCGVLGAVSDIRRRNRFCDFDLVSFSDDFVSDHAFVGEICLFLQSYFIPDESALFLFFPSHFRAYHSIGRCFLSFIRTTEELNAIVSSRPIGLAISTEWLRDDIHFVDFLCLQNQPSSMIYLYKLLQAHFIRTCLYSHACIFRKEDSPSLGIVPFLQFSANVYLLPSQIQRAVVLPPGIRFFFLQDKFGSLWIDSVLPLLYSVFSLIGVSSFSALMELVRARILFIGMLIEKEDVVHAIYVVRDSRTVYLGGGGREGALIQMVSSVSFSSSSSLFSTGFLYFIREVVYSLGGASVVQYLMVDSISHNVDLLLLFLDSDKKIFQTHHVYYYAYNLIMPSLLPRECFFLF